MRPYLAVLKDSYREACASSLLWIVLGLVILSLVVLSGFGLSEKMAADLAQQDIVLEQPLADELIAAGKSDTPTAVRHIWRAMSPDSQERITRFATSKGPRMGGTVLKEELRRDLNRLLDRKDLYDAQLWKSAGLNPEAESMAARGVDKLSATELRRFNRLVLEAAFDFSLAPVGESQSQLTYLVWDVPVPLMGQPPRQLVGAFLAQGLRIFLGIGGLIVAIVVTSSTIPQMFEPGSIDLLLSKPVSRPILFITRFVGGCTFVLLNATVLVMGIWLICGVRLGLWYPRLWLCIPLFTFLFMVYYAVSAMAGLVWKNAIIACLMTAVFMGLCTSLSLWKWSVQTFGMEHLRLTRLVAAGPDLIAAEKNGQVFEWKNPEWRSTFKERRLDMDATVLQIFPYAGPVYDAPHDRLVALESQGGFGQHGARGTLLSAPRKEGWHAVETAMTSEFGTVELFVDPRGELVTVGTQGVHRLVGDLSRKPVRQFLLFGQDLARDPLAPRWQPVGPASWRGPMAAAIDEAGHVAVVAQGVVTRLVRDPKGMYVPGGRKDLKFGESALIACRGKSLAVATAKGKLIVLDAESMAVRTELTALAEEQPRQLEFSGDGKWLFLLTHEKTLKVLDVGSGALRNAPLRGQRDIASMTVAGDRLLVNDFHRRVTEYEIGSWTWRRAYDPTLSLWERANFYVIFPLYSVLPKPDDMSAALSEYMLEQSRSQATNQHDDDLKATRIVNYPWDAFWSNVAFVCVMLALGSVYVSRKDF